MKKLLQMTPVAAVVLGLILICPPARGGTPAEQKIGTVDLQKVFDKYYKTVRSKMALKQEEDDIRKEGTDMADAYKKSSSEWQKLLEKSDDQSLSAEERAKAKKAAQEKYRELESAKQSLQEYDRMSMAKLQERNRQRRDDIVKEIRNVLNADAKAAGYTLVLDVSGESANIVPIVLYSTGVNDMTDNLIKELNAGAPPLSADEASPTNSVKEAK